MFRTRTGSAVDLLVVGLGNPGAEFERTRHNVGAEAVALLATRHGGTLRPEKGLRSLACTVKFGEHSLALAYPQTYMNDSGLAGTQLVRRFGIDDLHQLVVIHDELDLPPGRVKLKVGGGDAGHNGLRSLRSHLHSGDYIRVRIGVGKPPGRQNGADYVLRRPGKADREILDLAVVSAADAVEAVATDGIEAAMNRFNSDS